MPRLLSVNVGLPRDVTWNGKTVRTSVWKSPVAGRRIVRKLNIDGDAQADLAGHGGEHRAVFVYQMDSYHYWERFLGRTDFTFGQFGENFTVEGLPDNEVCIGDRYRIGSAEFEVTQPRVTCYRVGIRMNEPRMPALLVAHHRPGFYFRVLQEGEVGAGDDIVKIADGPEKMSVADVDALLYLPGRSSEQLQRALQIPALSKGWQSSFQAMLQQDLSSKTTVGNPGLASEEQAPAWPGFRQMRVANIHKESASVTSFILTPIDGRPFPLYQAGQFVVVRVFVDPGKPPVLRSYSLSDLPAADHFRISVKSELNGIASSFLCDRAREGDLLEVSAPRGTFTLRPSQSPVVLLSAGVGATPVMSMLHSLVAEKSQREIWWVYGARNGVDHPFAEESRFLLKRLSRGRNASTFTMGWPTTGSQLKLQLGHQSFEPASVPTGLHADAHGFVRTRQSTVELIRFAGMCEPFLLDLSGRGVEQSDLLKLGMEIYSYNDHRSAPFSRACWLVLPPPTLTRVREPTLSWNQFHSLTLDTRQQCAMRLPVLGSKARAVGQVCLLRVLHLCGMTLGLQRASGQSHWSTSQRWCSSLWRAPAAIQPQL